MARIGILGGSFDPVHHGHLAIADFASSELDLGRVIFVPASRNPLKKKPRFSDKERLSRLKKALSGRPSYSVSDHELKKAGPSYTVDTLRHFKRKFGPGNVLYFLSGADTPRDFSRWKSPGKVLKLCRFVVMTRPGSKMRFSDRRFLWLAMPPVKVSSSGIRAGKESSRLKSPRRKTSTPRKK